MAKEGMLTITHAGEVVAADTIVGYPRSLNAYQHVFHVCDVYTNFGVAWTVKSKVVEHLMMYWLQHSERVTRHWPRQLRIDGGEAKTTRCSHFV